MASGDIKGHTKGPVTCSFWWNIMRSRRQSEINFEGSIDLLSLEITYDSWECYSTKWNIW